MFIIDFDKPAVLGVATLRLREDDFGELQVFLLIFVEVELLGCGMTVGLGLDDEYLVNAADVCVHVELKVDVSRTVRILKGSLLRLVEHQHTVLFTLQAFHDKGQDRTHVI